MSIELNYFYGNEAEQFTFYRIPKLLITSPEFKRVSDSAKLLYGLMLDRMSLSIKNGWLDEQQRAYIFFTTNDVMKQMCCGTEKATKLLAELDSEKGIGLIERKKQGQGKPTIIHLKKFILTDNAEQQNPRLSEIKSQDFGKPKSKTSDNQNPRLSEAENTDFRSSKCNDNNMSDNKGDNTKRSDNKILSYPIRENEAIASSSASTKESPDMIRWIEERNSYESLIKQNIDYDIIVSEYSSVWLDEIVEIMVDVVCSKEPYIRINKQNYPQETV